MELAYINYKGLNLEITGTYKPQDEETGYAERFEIEEVFWIKKDGNNLLNIDITDIYCACMDNVEIEELVLKQLN